MTKVSNPDKVMFPDSGYTKADVVGYYDAAAPAMAVHLVDRPLTLHRFPNGVGEKGFLQKNASDFFPDDILRVEVPKQEGGITTYAVLVEPNRIGYLANLGTVTFHVWTSSRPHLDRPDRLVFDLDPPEGATAAAADAADVVRAFLADVGLDSAVMTTGSKGYHVVVPIVPTLGYDRVGTMSQLAAALMVAGSPTLLTDQFRIAKREGRVFVDWLRNRVGQTGVAAWSARARPGAPVATPIAWDEITATPPDAYTILSAPDRFDIDPIADLAKHPVDLTDAAAKTAAIAAESGVEPAQFDRFRS